MGNDLQIYNRNLNVNLTFAISALIIVIVFHTEPFVKSPTYHTISQDFKSLQILSTYCIHACKQLIIRGGIFRLVTHSYLSP